MNIHISLYWLIYFIILNCVYLCAVLCLVAQSCPTLNPVDCSPPGCSVHGDSPGKNTEVGCHAFLQEIFSTKRLNPGLPQCRWILYCLNHQGSPRILEWVVYPFSRGSSQPRGRTQSPTLQADSLQSEPPRKPDGITVGQSQWMRHVWTLPCQLALWGFELRKPD